MYSKITLYSVLIILTVIFKNFDLSEFGEVNQNVNRRKKQTLQLDKKNILSETLEEQLEEKININKKVQVELLCRQAGIIISYYNFLSIQIVNIIIVSLLIYYFTKNMFMVLVFGLVAYKVPIEVVRFLKNKRINAIEKQLGSFMEMVIKRYQNVGDMKQALEATAYDLQGEEPIISEIEATIEEMELGVSQVQALRNMAERVDNKFFTRFVTYYDIASDVGTAEARRDLLEQAHKQYEENRKIKKRLEKAIYEPVKDAYLMTAIVPVMAFMAYKNIDNYIPIMTQTTIGKIGSAFIVGAIIGSIWVINTKIAAPLDKEFEQKEKKE